MLRGARRGCPRSGARSDHGAPGVFGDREAYIGDERVRVRIYLSEKDGICRRVEGHARDCHGCAERTITESARWCSTGRADLWVDDRLPASPVVPPRTCRPVQVGEHVGGQRCSTPRSGRCRSAAGSDDRRRHGAGARRRARSDGSSARPWSEADSCSRGGHRDPVRLGPAVGGRLPAHAAARRRLLRRGVKRRFERVARSRGRRQVGPASCAGGVRPTRGESKPRDLSDALLRIEDLLAASGMKSGNFCSRKLRWDSVTQSKPPRYTVKPAASDVAGRRAPPCRERTG